MPNVESKIVVNIRAVVDGLPQVKELSASVNALNKKTSGTLVNDLGKVEKGFLGIASSGRLARIAAFNPLAAAGNVLAGVFHRLVFQINFLLASLALFLASSPALGFGLLIKEGLEFNSVMEQTKIGLSALIQSTSELFRKDQPNKPLEGLEAFQAASAIAESAAVRLRIKIIPLKATSEELLPIFNQIVVAGAAAGFTLTQTEDTFISLASAAQILNIPIERLGTEIRLFLGGVTRETSRLGPALFGTAAAAREFVKEHKAAGDLFPALQQKLVAYNLALARSESSFATLAENSKEVFQVLSGLATTGVFEKIKQGLTLINRGFFDLQAGKLKPEFEALFNFINNELTRLGDFIIVVVQKAIDALGQVATYVKDNAQDINNILNDLLNIGIQLGGFVVDLATIVGDVDAARAETANWHTILGFIAITLAIIRDAINLIIGIFQVLGGVILIDLLDPLKATLAILGLISDAAADAAQKIEAVQQGALTFVEQGAKRMENALNGSATNAAVERFLNGTQVGTNRTKRDSSEDFTSKLKKFKAPVDQEKQNTENRLGQLRQTIARLERQLADERISTERAMEEKLFAIQKGADDEKIAQLKTTLDHQLVSVQDYYDQKQKLDDQELEAERKRLKANFEFDKQLINNKLGEINDKFVAASAEPKNKDPRIQAELKHQKEIEELVEINNFKQKQIKLEEDLALLDQRRAKTLTDNTTALNDALEKQAEGASNIQSSLLEVTGREADAEIRRIALQYKETIKETLINTNPATDALKNVIEEIGTLGSVTSSELINILNQAGVKFDELSESTKALIKLMQQTEQQAVFKGFQTGISLRQGFLDVQKAEIQDRVNRGVISEAAGRREIAAAEQAARIELEKFVAKMEGLPGLTEQERLAIAQIRGDLSQMGREMDVVGNQINDVVSNDLGSFFNTILEGNQSIGESFRQLLSGLLIDIAKVIFQAIILKSILSALGLSKSGTAGPGSAGGLGGILSGIFGSIGGKADGGPIGGDGAVSGPGTSRSDSILARLSNGEWVVPATRVSQYGRGLMAAITNGTFGNALRGFAAGGLVGDLAGRGGPGTTNMSLRNINLFDPALLTSTLNTPHGERAMLNLVSHNPDKFRRALGL